MISLLLVLLPPGQYVLVPPVKHVLRFLLVLVSPGWYILVLLLLVLFLLDGTFWFRFSWSVGPGSSCMSALGAEVQLLFADLFRWGAKRLPCIETKDCRRCVS